VPRGCSDDETHPPQVLQRLEMAAREVDAEQSWGLLRPCGGGGGGGDQEKAGECGPVRWRNVELHVVRPGGALSDPEHFDGGSLITVDVMLAGAADFEGGVFTTPEGGAGYGRDPSMGETWRAHEFERGDALFFQSHKRHGVTPVRSGCRRVLVRVHPGRGGAGCACVWWGQWWWRRVMSGAASGGGPRWRSCGTGPSGTARTAVSSAGGRVATRWRWLAGKGCTSSLQPASTRSEHINIM
jgi:hypothetical protein